MSVLAELLLEIIELGVGPSSDRGLVVTFALGSLAIGSLAIWLMVTSPDLLSQQGWGLAVLVGSPMVGGSGVLVSSLRMRRNASDRLLAILCLATNVYAVAVPMLWLIAR